MLPAQQAQPYGSRSSQQFQPLGHANVVMPQPSQIQFPQPMQQVTGRPVVGRHSMPQGPPIPQDFQRNLPMSNNHMPGSGGPNLPLSSYNQVNADSSASQYQTQINDHRFSSGVQPWMPISNHNVNSATTMQKTGELAAPLVVPREDASTDWREFTSPEGRKYYYNKVTRTSKWRMPDEVKVMLDLNPIWLAREKDIISHASDFGSIPVVKTSSPGADGSLVSAHGAKSSPIAVSPAANLPTILASESSSLSGKVSSMMIETVEIKNSSEPSSPAVADSEKIGIAYLSQKKKLEAEERRVKQKKAREDFRTMLEDWKELSSSSRCSKAISIFEHDERFKAVERAKDHEDLFEDYVEELEKKEHAKALEEQKHNKVEYLEFLKSCDFIKASSQWRKVQDRLETNERCSCLEKIYRLEIFQEYIRDLESEEEEQRKLRMIKDFAAYLAVSSNTSGLTAKDLFTYVMDELEKQYLDDKSQIKDAVRMAEIGLTSAWTLDDFKVAIAKYISSPPMSDTNLKFVFEKLLERAREKEEKEAKKRKRLADEFYEFLHASKEITASSKWEDCKSLFGDSQVAFFAFIDLELVTRLQGPLESDN
ncbi:Pre-mRNA-processing protein 40A [Capsicum chinense]|nr:Pre-mRNA-processing protein 40A [Capsicum chinense]